MATEEVADDLARHTGRRPGRDIAGGHDAGVGEAGLLCRGAPAFNHGHLVAVCGQLIGSGDADDAGTDDGHPHADMPWATQVVVMVVGEPEILVCIVLGVKRARDLNVGGKTA